MTKKADLVSCNSCHPTFFKKKKKKKKMSVYLFHQVVKKMVLTVSTIPTPYGCFKLNPTAVLFCTKLKPGAHPLYKPGAHPLYKQ